MRSLICIDIGLQIRGPKPAGVQFGPKVPRTGESGEKHALFSVALIVLGVAPESHQVRCW